MIALQVQVYDDEATLSNVIDQLVTQARTLNCAVTVAAWPSKPDWRWRYGSITALPGESAQDVMNALKATGPRQ